jgi:signal transduction histidine kinase
MSSQPARSELARDPGVLPSRYLRGRWLLLARVCWAAVVLTTVGLFVVALPVRYDQMVSLSNLPEAIDPSVLRTNLAEEGLSTGFYAAYRLATETGFAAVCVTLGIIIFWRRSEERMALFVALLLVLLGTTFWSTIQALTAVHPAGGTAFRIFDSLSNASLFIFFYLFPDGRFVPRWTRWLAAAMILLVALSFFFPDSPLNPDNYPVPIFLLFLLGLLLTGVFAQVYRYRRVSGPVERQQAKWVVFGFAAALCGFLAVLFFGEVLFSVEPGTISELIGMTAITLSMLLIPLSIGVAILRYRLFDIDVVINRTLVYGALTAIVVGLYVLVVGYLGALFRTGGNLAISLVATGIVAVLFAPLKERLQRGVNRLMYGERDDPYAVLSRLGRRLEGTLAPEAVLPAIVEDVARALRLGHVAIWLADNDTLRLGAAHGTTPPETTVRDVSAVEALRSAPDGLRPAELSTSGEYGAVLAACGTALVLPLTHRGELVGALCLAPRGPGEGFSEADRRLLRDLATQAGAAAHAVRLTVALRSSLEDLRRSREKLVAAQDEERRRIQRDLHDGLGPVLASMRLRLEACLDATQKTGDPLADDLERLYELVGQATADIRRLVYDLRPPVLDQLGLVPALRQHCERFGRESSVEVRFEAEEGLPVPAAAEVALLRVAQEALVNVGKHARASRVELRLARNDGWLGLEVRDDGAGFDPNGHLPEGTGIASMRERAELLGGTLHVDSRPGAGTRVAARIPVEGATR